MVADELPRRAFERTLSDHGHEPVFANGPEQAIAMANARDLRLFVIDLHHLSLQAANDLAEKLLAARPAAHAMIIHDPPAEGRSRSDISGQIQFLQRPFSMLEFISTVDQALSVEL